MNFNIIIPYKKKNIYDVINPIVCPTMNFNIIIPYKKKYIYDIINFMMSLIQSSVQSMNCPIFKTLTATSFEKGWENIAILIVNYELT